MPAWKDTGCWNLRKWDHHYGQSFLKKYVASLSNIKSNQFFRLQKTYF